MSTKHKRIYLNAPLTLSFVGLCLIALLIDKYTNGEANKYLFSTYSTNKVDAMYCIRLLLHVFGHTSFKHFFNNMLYILLLGPILEEKYGNKLIVVILFTAIMTGIIHNILDKETALIGASGVVFAFIILSSFVNKNKGVPITFILVLIMYLGQEIIDLFNTDSISQLAHIVGGLCGAIMAYFLK